MIPIRNLLINLEKQINASDSNSNSNYYDFIDLYEKEIIMIYNCICSQHDQLISFFLTKKELLEKLHLNFNNVIKNETEYMYVILSIFIIKATTDFSNYTTEEIDLLFESDKLINAISHDFINFLIWIEIYYNKNVIIKVIPTYNLKKLRLGIYKIFELLTNERIMKREKRQIKNKTLIFYIINCEHKNFIFTNLFTKKFQIYKNTCLYIFIDHYTNIFKLLKENVYSSRTIKIEENSPFFKNLLEIKAKIDYESLNFFFELLLKKNNCKRDDLYQNYSTIIYEIKNAINKKDGHSLSNFSKKLTEILNMIRVFEIINNKNDTFFYFPVSLCFRGRTYFSSSIGFTLYKEFRYCLYTGEYDTDFSLPFHPLNKQIQNSLSSYMHFVDQIRKFDFKNKTENVKHDILWILISIAEIQKKKLGDKVKFEEFINHAIKIVNKEILIKFEDEYEHFKFYSLIKILKEIETGCNIKRLVSKDATASAFQHLIKILGNNNQESLQWCNLSSLDTWYDTYSYILKKWKELALKNYSDNEKIIIDKYFIRKSIKKPTMTIQYGAKFNTCWKYFIDALVIENDCDLDFLKKVFFEYYNFINSNVGILKISSKEIINAIQNNNCIVKLEDGTEIDLNYYLSKTSQIKFVMDQKRFTKQNLVLLTKKNIKKINTSSRANYIHIHDAAVVRYIIAIVPILTIHDCFLIDYRSTTFLISILNEAMQKTFHDLKLNKEFDITKIYSIFIII